MKAKVFLTVFLIFIFATAGSICYFSLSRAQAETSSAGDFEKKITEKLDRVLANQSDIISRLQALDRLVRTRKVD